MKWPSRVVLLVTSIAALIAMAIVIHSNLSTQIPVIPSEQTPGPQLSQPTAKDGKAGTVAEIAAEEIEVEEVFYQTTATVRKNSSFYQTLKNAGVEGSELIALIQSTKSVKDLRSVRPGTDVELSWTDESAQELVRVEMPLATAQSLRIDSSIGPDGMKQWKAEIVQEPILKTEVHFSGVVKSTLWESARAANLSPSQIILLAEVFAWQVDFSREVRAGDTWKLTTYEKRTSTSNVGWGPILAAEYVNGGEVYQAVRFDSDGTHPSGYYQPDGSSLQRMFLKSPIKFGRVTSRFNMNRFHPVLKVRRPHLGVDYGAPVGTPIRSTGEGRVTYVGWKGGGGKTVKIRHNAVYSTAYKHLSRYGKNIRPGARVEQGQTIGYVGATGLATGPHLHYEFFKNGRFVDPQTQTFPSANPLPQQYLDDFQVMAERRLKTLNIAVNQAEENRTAVREDTKPASSTTL